MRASALRIVRRGLATAAAHPPHAAAASSHVTAAASAIPLSNVEAQWATLNQAEQAAVHQQLEELQRKDWKTLSLSEKKAGTSIFFSWLSDHPPIIFIRAIVATSLLCRIWPAWTSRTGEPTGYDCQSPSWRFCPRWYCRAPLRGHPRHWYGHFRKYRSLSYPHILFFFSSSPAATKDDQ